MRRASILALLALAAASLKADGGSGLTGASSFSLIRGARPAALGGAYVAVADDAYSMLYNPAGLVQLREVQLQATHMEWLDGIRDDEAMLGVPIYGFGAYGIGASYLYTTDEGRDNWGNSTGDFNDFDFSMQASLALQLGSDGALGVTYKILRQGYEHAFDMGSGFDAGFQYRGFFDRHLSLGLEAMNMGTDFAVGKSNAPQPLTLKGGAAVFITRDWFVTADYEYQPYDYFSKVHAGTEYDIEVSDELSWALRAGYLYGPENADGSLAGLAAGFGVRWTAWGLDYTYAPQGDLGNAHRITLSYGFGQH